MSTFTLLDQLVFILYLILVVGFGSLFFRGQKTTEDYFLGDRKMPWLPVGISIFATTFSAISLLGSTGWVYDHNLTLGLGVLTIPLVTPVVILVFLPFYHRLRVFTAYEYLEHRFNPAVRTVASLVFLLRRGTYLAVVIYAPSLALSTATGFSLSHTILLVGGLATLYTLLGGMRAVIWTDVIQAFVLFAGLLLVVGVMLSGIEGGLLQVIPAGAEVGRFTVDFSIGDWSTISIWAVLISGIFTNLSQYGADQIVLQRYLTTSSVRAAGKSIILNAIAVIPVSLLLLLLGGGLYVYYSTNPERLTDATGGDAILPYFVIHELPSGVSGIFIAAMFAAAMSSIDSTINSLATASLKDFYERFFHRNATQAVYLKLSRVLTLLWGASATCGALYIQYFENIFSASKTFGGLFGGVLIGLFLLGMLTKRATSRGVLVGVVFGFVCVLFVSRSTSSSFLWYAPLGCVATMLMGYALSCLQNSGGVQDLQDLVLRPFRDSENKGRRRPDA